MLVAGAILLFFLVVGEPVLDRIGASLLSFRMAGGIIFFLFGVQMVFSEPSNSAANADGEPPTAREVAIYPIAIPSLASPGAILAVVLMTRNDSYAVEEQAVTAGLLVGVLLMTMVMLLLADKIYRLIGKAGASLLVRVLGLLLAAIAGQMIIDAAIEIARKV